MLGERELQRGGGALEISACGMEEAAAAGRDGQAPGNLRTSGAFLEAAEQLFGSLELADRDRGLDRVAVHAPDRRLAEVDAVELGERL